MSSATIAPDFLEPPREEGELGRLGPYRVVGLLGHGGMGHVYRAEDSRLQRTVALKVMNRRFAATPHARQRFIDEARSMAAVHHDNVATIFEVGQKDNTPFMAMELLRGQTLEQAVLAGRKFSPDEVIEIALQTAAGLAAAHARGITHRDIKPANLWLQDPGERIKILDFGLALAGSGIDQLSEVGSVIGTPGYLSPEQARNEPVDDRTDLYALGVVMYELCAGRLPLLASSVASHLVTIICHPPTPITERVPDLPPPLAQLIMRLLEKEPRNRIATAERLQSELTATAERIASSNQQALDIVVAPEDSRTRRHKQSDALDSSPSAGPKLLLGLPLRHWGAIAASATVLVVAIYLFTRPKRVAQTPMAMPAPLAKHLAKPSPVVLAKQLTMLQLEDNVVGMSEVAAGEMARIQIQVSNLATSAANDPRVLHKDASQIAKVVTFMRRGDGPKQATQSYPLFFSPAQLPGPGETKNVDLQFLTSQLPLAEYQLIVELQAPGGAIVDTARTRLRIDENLMQSELLDFKTIRTLDGKGADATVAKGKGKPMSREDHVEVREGGDNAAFAVLRFDLTKLSDRNATFDAASIDRAVLRLTVAQDSYAGNATFRVYGWPNDLPGQEPAADAWQENGEPSLKFSNSPVAGGGDSLTFLDNLVIDNVKKNLNDQPDQVRLASTRLDDFLRSQTSGLATFVIARENGGKKSTRFVSRNAGKPERAPALSVRLLGLSETGVR